MAWLKKILNNKLTKQQLSLVPRSYDIIGKIAIFSDFPKELKNKEKTISNALIETNKNIETVAKKTSNIYGKYRIRKLKIISGKKTKETIHRENGVQVKLNVEKCYFTPRLNTERLRIASLVKKNETILVMFSGVAIYNLVIAKNSNAKEIYGIEINPTAHKYALENLKLNKNNNIKLFLGDVKKITPKLKVKFDRIIMPLPASSQDYLTDAFKVAKKGTIIHIYTFNLVEIKERLKKEKAKILNIIKTGQVSTKKYRYCIDFRIT